MEKNTTFLSYESALNKNETLRGNEQPLLLLVEMCSRPQMDWNLPVLWRHYSSLKQPMDPVNVKNSRHVKRTNIKISEITTVVWMCVCLALWSKNDLIHRRNTYSEWIFWVPSEGVFLKTGHSQASPYVQGAETAILTLESDNIDTVFPQK